MSMLLKQWIAGMSSGTNWSSYWNTPFSATNEGGDGRWMIQLCQSPVNTSLIKTIVWHGPNMRIRTSTDKGQTWGDFSTIYSLPAGSVHQDLSSGYSTDGRLHIVWSEHTAEPVWLLKYIYSDDNGANWSVAADISDLVPSGYPIFSAFGNIIENAGVVLSNFYCVDAPEGSMTTSRIYLLRLVAGVWSAVLVTDDFYENESSIIGLGGNNLMLLARWETAPANRFMQYFSSDNGLTWIKHGMVDFQLAAGTEHKQPVLKKFLDKPGTDEIIVAYFPHMYAVDRPVYACYARRDDLVAYGTLGWNMSNVKEILNYPEVTVYYGDVCHYNNDYKAIGAMIAYDDALHHTGIIRFNIDTTDHDIRAALWGASTISKADAELWSLFSSNVANVAQWVDFRDRTKMVKNYTTSIVSRWNCRLRTGNDYTTGAGLLTATGMYFNGGVNDFLRTEAIAALNSQPTFIYIVFKMTRWRALDHILSGLAEWTFSLLQWNADSTPEIRGYLSASKFTGKSNELALNTYGIVRFAANGADSFISVNLGAEKKQDNGAGVAGGLILGKAPAGGYASQIEVKEVITLTYIPDAAEQAYTMTRLAAKNGTTL